MNTYLVPLRRRAPLRPNAEYRCVFGSAAEADFPRTIATDNWAIIIKAFDQSVISEIVMRDHPAYQPILSKTEIL